MTSPRTMYDHVTSLRVVRKYHPDPLSTDEITRILEAGRWTGSSKNTQPWSFIVVTDPGDRQRLAECGDFTGPLIGAPLVIVVVRHPDGGDFDMGRAAQNMMLAAAALGIASCPVTLHRESCARQRLGVPEDHGSRWAIAFGYPDMAGERELREKRRRDETAQIPTGRKPLDGLVHYGSFRAGG